MNTSGLASYHPTTETALILAPPPDICGYADHYRRLYMPGEVERIEPHVTITYPFVSAPALREVEPRLREVVARCEPVWLSLRGFGVFEESGVLYLRLAHPERVEAIYRAVLAEFPDYPIYGGQVKGEYLPHITVGVFEDRAELERVFEELALQRLFIGWEADRVLVKLKMSDGIWDTWGELPMVGSG